MSGHRRAAALVAALLVAFMLPAIAPPGIARGAEPSPAALPPPPIAGTISGFALGSDGGTLAGGTITACVVSTFDCSSATIAGDDSYSVTVLTGFAYRVSIDPPFPYFSGYYDDVAPGAFTRNIAEATAVPVFIGDVFLRTMVVPRSFVPPPAFGSISGYMFGANDGPLTGTTVTACSATWACSNGTVGSDGYYWIGYLPAGTYTLAITPPLGSGYASGYYAAWAQGFFTTSSASATAFSVWNTNVTLPTIVVQWGHPIPAYGAISGTVVGASGGSLAGGTVTACSATYSCWSATIGSTGAYHVGYLPASVYVVSITPPSSAYLTGFYAAGAAGNFTTSASSATGVTVWNADVLLPTIVVPWAPTYGSISGRAVGLSDGALAGGTVTACNAAASCANATIGADGSYWIGTLPSGSYTVKITPTSTSGYPTGYYASGASGYFTTSASSATVVNVAGAGVALPKIVVPWTGSGTGGIVVDHPKAYVVWAYLRPEFTEGTTTSLRIAQGERAELASYIDPALSGMRVEVWRRLKGKAWVMITTRGISGAGWVVYRFTATGGTNGAQYRFHLPATSLTTSVWSVARTVRLL